MINRTQVSALIASTILAVGIALAGWFVGQAYFNARTAGGTVTVKGLAEREVTADRAIWPLTLIATGDVLKEVQTEIDADRARLLTFLTQAGFVDASIAVESPEVTDLRAQRYGNVDTSRDRYILTQSVILRTPNVDLVHETNSQTRELIAQGVTLSHDGTPSSAGSGPPGPRYVFSRLNDIKPSMLAEATTNARAAAEQFAADAGSKLGTISNANQGVFQILPRDGLRSVPEWTRRLKKVRVVSTVTYRLVD